MGCAHIDKLEHTNEPRLEAKTRLAFAHFRNTYVREAFDNGPSAEFFRRHYGDGFYAKIGTVDLNWLDQCEIALRFDSIDLAVVNIDALAYIFGRPQRARIRRVEISCVGNATFVIALIELRLLCESADCANGISP